MKWLTILIITIVSVSFISVDAMAWPDGKREGLLLGITGGLGSSEFSNGVSGDGTSFMAGLYIGAGISEQTLLNFRYRYYNTDIDDVAYHTFAWTGDVIFYPTIGSGFFINGGIGYSVVAIDRPNTEDKDGMYYYAGIGYEITKWVFLSLDYSFANLSDGMTGKIITLGVSVIGY